MLILTVTSWHYACNVLTEPFTSRCTCIQHVCWPISDAHRQRNLTLSFPAGSHDTMGDYSPTINALYNTRKLLLLSISKYTTIQTIPCYSRYSLHFVF